MQENQEDIFGIPKKASSPVWKIFKLKRESNGNFNSSNAYCTECGMKSFSYHGSTSNLKDHIASEHANLFKNLFLKDSAPLAISTPLAVGISDKITDLIAKMMVLDLQPTTLVENRGFRDLIKHLEPRYKIPSRKFFSNTYIPKLYDEVCLLNTPNNIG